ncbi:hypothetical protein HQN90_23870 [Paenibacillus alba]|uniref:hypothetical protein n=1 Tax=Paenibacillus alba TaxID=1197127 RepID=UPI0015632730|nr:hypothetical protein [Paenibacillus alba]NQX69174.1 hypothetical protein [Paenibacillus alba]
MKQINMGIWFWARIFLLIALVVAFFSRHEEPQAKTKFERIQWAGEVKDWLPKQEDKESYEQVKRVMPELIVNHLNPSARIQLSLHLKPIDVNHSEEVYPVGSGVLVHGDQKIAIYVNATSTLMKHILKDGSVYIQGSMHTILTAKSKQTNAVLAIEGLMGTDEFEITYPYTDEAGTIVFGKGIHSHLDEINSLRK